MAWSSKNSHALIVQYYKHDIWNNGNSYGKQTAREEERIRVWNIELGISYLSKSSDSKPTFVFSPKPYSHKLTPTHIYVHAICTHRDECILTKWTWPHTPPGICTHIRTDSPKLTWEDLAQAATRHDKSLHRLFKGIAPKERHIYCLWLKQEKQSRFSYTRDGSNRVEFEEMREENQ